MRIERAVTTVSLDPVGLTLGDAEGGREAGGGAPRRATAGQAARLGGGHAADAAAPRSLPVRQPSAGVGGGRGRRDRGQRVRRQGVHGRHHGEPRRRRRHSPGGLLPRSALGARGGGGLGAVPSDDGRSYWRADPPQGEAGAVLPDHQPDRLDDAGADHLGRRPARGPAGRGQRVPRHWVYDDSGALVPRAGSRT